MYILIFKQADVLACTVGIDLGIATSEIGKALLSKAGQTLQNTLNKQFSSSRRIQPGEIAVVESSGGLSCKYVFFGNLEFCSSVSIKGMSKQDFCRQVV